MFISLLILLYIPVVLFSIPIALFQRFVDFSKSSCLSSRSWTAMSIKRSLIGGINLFSMLTTVQQWLKNCIPYLMPDILIKSNIPANQLYFHTGFARWWYDKNTAVRISVAIAFLLVGVFVITLGCFCGCCCRCKPCKRRSNGVVWKRNNKVRVILCLYSTIIYSLLFTYPTHFSNLPFASPLFSSLFYSPLRFFCLLFLFFSSLFSCFFFIPGFSIVLHCILLQLSSNVLCF